MNSSAHRPPRTPTPAAPAASGPGDAFDWRLRGACADLDADLFFPEPDDPAEAALAACAGCAVRAECLAWALTTNQSHGIWGGTTEHDRLAARTGTHRPADVPAAAHQTGEAA